MLQRQMDDVEETVGVLCHRCESEVTTAGIPGGVSDDMCLTEETLETVENLPYKDPAERKDVNKILGYLENHLVGKVNEIYESYRFFSRQQEEFESISAYVTAVHALASTCNFGDLRERLIRDRIVCGIRNKALQRSLLSELNLTLESCVQKRKTSEAAGQQVQAGYKE